MRVRLTPNSSSCGIRGIFVDADGLEYLKINVVAVPEKGKANRELIKFLAGRLKLPKSEIRIAGGETDRWDLPNRHATRRLHLKGCRL